MKIFKTLFSISASDLSDDSGQVNYENRLNAVVAPTNHLLNTDGPMLRFDAISLELS